MSIFLIAVGAILRYAINVTVEGVEIDTVGLILMIVGIVGFVIGVIYEIVVVRERSRWYQYWGRDRYGAPGPDGPTHRHYE